MKFASAVIALSLVSFNCFASSVCIFSIPDTMGGEATLSCDGKTKNIFAVNENWLSSQSLALKDILSKGYKIATECRDAGADQYTLVKE